MESLENFLNSPQALGYVLGIISFIFLIFIFIHFLKINKWSFKKTIKEIFFEL